MVALTYTIKPKYTCPICHRSINGSEWAYSCSDCHVVGGRTIGVRQKAINAKKRKG